MRFRVFALRRRALGSLLLALERRRITHPKAQDYANFQSALHQGFATGEMGLRGQFALPKSGAADVRFGSKADIVRYQRERLPTALLINCVVRLSFFVHLEQTIFHARFQPASGWNAA